MNKLIKKHFAMLSIIAAGTIFTGCSGLGCSTNNNSDGTATQIGTVDGHPVMISSSQFTMPYNESGIIGSISITGLTSTSAPITLTFTSPNGQIVNAGHLQTDMNANPILAPLPQPCVISESKPLCQLSVNGNNANNGTYNYTVTATTHGQTTTLTNPIPVVVSGIDPNPIKSGTLSIMLESTAVVGDTPTAIITLNNSRNITTPISVSTTSSDDSVLALTPTVQACNLTSTSNTCEIALSANSTGAATIAATATSYDSVEQTVNIAAVPTPTWGSITETNSDNSIKVGGTVTLTYKLRDDSGVNSVTIQAIPSDTTSFDSNNYSCTINRNTNQRKCTIVATAESVSSGTYFTSNITATTPTGGTYTINNSPNIVISPANNEKWLFVSESSPQGDMFSTVAPFNNQPIGVYRADTICESNAMDSNWVPESIANATVAGTMHWKAMIVDGKNRNAYPNQIDWIFTPNTIYYDIKSDKKIFTTNESAIFNFLPSNKANNTFGTGTGYNWSSYNDSLIVWTGLMDDWSVAQNLCSKWSTTDSASHSGFTGYPINHGSHIKTYNMISSANRPCNLQDTQNSYAVRLICVQQ